MGVAEGVPQHYVGVGDGAVLLGPARQAVAALALVEVLLPAYGSFMGRPLALHYLTDWPLTLAIVGVGILAGLLSGFYPALVLSGFRPATTLRANTSGQSGSGRLRNGLVILQFAVSIGLGIAALVVFAQTSFARHIELGFQKDGIILVSAGDLPPKARESFMHALAANPNILAVARSGSQAIPFANSTNNIDVQVPGRPTAESFRRSDVSPDFPKVYEIPLLAGRLLSENRASDTVS